MVFNCSATFSVICQTRTYCQLAPAATGFPLLSTKSEYPATGALGFKPPPGVSPVPAPVTGLTPGGGLNPNAPVAGYSDFVDKSGNPVAAGANWQYVRVWQITENVALQLKTITVLTQVRYDVGQGGILPKSALTCLKSSPF